AGGVRVDVADLAGVRLPRDVELAAWYCSQEAVQNTLRHAPGAALTLRASLRGSALELEVRDDGPGFDPASAGAGGTGLAGLCVRAASAGGTADVLSAPGAGTTVRVRLPLPADRGGADADVTRSPALTQ
ncbi:MAG: ATP-binding protein, partial [Actinomycetota bacterium]|nr:ATP-binding protein [Actinomycetota bacterium]